MIWKLHSKILHLRVGFVNLESMASAITAHVTGSGEASGRQQRPVILIPWDPDSPEHVDRMVEQRIACGWKHDYVEKWRDQQRDGKIGLHWIVSIEAIL